MHIFIQYDVRDDVQYLVPYRDISPGIWYLIYNFANRYIADIRCLKTLSASCFLEFIFMSLPCYINHSGDFSVKMYLLVVNILITLWLLLVGKN